MQLNEIMVTAYCGRHAQAGEFPDGAFGVMRRGAECREQPAGRGLRFGNACALNQKDSPLKAPSPGASGCGEHGPSFSAS